MNMNKIWDWTALIVSGIMVFGGNIFIFYGMWGGAFLMLAGFISGMTAYDSIKESSQSTSKEKRE